jgi:YegS/Rv2252/BmrU family lipid kinase
MSDVPLIIVNPKSGRGLTEKQWASITVRLRRRIAVFDTAFTGGVGDGIRIAEEEARRGRRRIIAMGGDGTISEVVTGILKSGTDAELGVLPRGTGGDFRRSLDLPSDLEDAAQKIVEGTPHPMDVGRIQYMDHEGRESERYFVNSASFGASGKVAGEANRSSKLLGGTITFLKATLKTTLTYDNPDVFLSLDDARRARLRIITVFIANGRYTGGGMKVAPEAKLNDGLLDIVTVGDFKVPEILMKSYRLYTGTHLSLDKVSFARAKKVYAEPAHPEEQVLLEVDGETPGRLPATFEILPGALTIRA